MAPKSYRFDAFTLDLERLCVDGPSGQAKLRRKSFEVLRYLVEHAGRVVTKEEVMNAVWPDVTVSDESLTQCIRDVRRAIGDESQRIIKTVPRRGYLLDVSISASDVPSAQASEPKTGATVEFPSSAPPLPNKPSIAVLPFTNMSSDSQQEYFSDGITEDIITALSRLRWFFVIARNSTFAYKGQSADVKQIARDLGVRYLLEGSVRKSGQRVRITAQLVDAITARHIWAERYDHELTDIFELQDEITASVAAAIEPKLLAAEGVRAETRSIDDLDAWDLVARALSHFWKLTAAGSEKAIVVLRQAVERHPNYAPAHSMLAFALLGSAHVGWTPPGSDRVLATQLAHRALELDDSDPWAHMALGNLAIINHQTDEAVRHFRSALDLNPNFATAYGYMGLALVHDGQSEEALHRFEQAMRMSPRDPFNARILAGVSAAHYLRGRYPEAVKWARQAVQLRPGVLGGHRMLCASLAQAGQVDEAKAAMNTLRQLQPDISIAVVKQSVPYAAKEMAHFLDGLCKAGLPQN
jgi:adenylate cyclase